MLLSVSCGRGAWHPCVCTVLHLSQAGWDNTLQSFLGNWEHLGKTRRLLVFCLLFSLSSLLPLSPSPSFPLSSPLLWAGCAENKLSDTPPAAPALIVTTTRSSPAVRSSGAALFARGRLPRCSKEAKVYLEEQTLNNNFYKPAQACRFLKKKRWNPMRPFYTPNSVDFQEFKSKVQIWTLLCVSVRPSSSLLIASDTVSQFQQYLIEG